MANSLLINSSPAGDIHLPPSKSFSHRALICAALAATGGGRSVISKAGLSEDIQATALALAHFGARVELQGDKICVSPAASSQEPIIDCGESGSTLRFLLPLAATLLRGRTVFTGRERLLERPLTAYTHVFAKSGVHFTQTATEVWVEGILRGDNYQLPGNISSQFISGLLLALPLAEKESALRLTTCLESAPYVAITLAVMKDFGVQVERPEPSLFVIPGRQRYQPAGYSLEADYSQAAFFLAASALGCPVSCHGLKPDSVQGDRAILEILKQMGAEITWSHAAVTATTKGRLKAVTVDVRETPDLVPALAALASLAEGTSRIINAGRLRLKESDRLSAMALELGKLGADITEEPEALIIKGLASLPGNVEVQAHNDHRVAMALAVASLGCQKPISIRGAGCVKKSYPAFWRDFGIDGDI